MEPQLLALIILAILYIPCFVFVKRSKWCKEHGLVTSSVLIMLKTKWGVDLMRRLGKYKRFWRVCGVISWIVTAVLMIGMVSILIIDMLVIPKMTSTAGLGVTYVLAIPGINPVLPFVYGWIGLIIAMVVHETAHGIQTMANDMEVENTGIIHCVVPLGAFVEPNNEQVQKCSRRARMDLYAAGITTNFFVAMVMFLLVSVGMTSGITSDYGDNPAIIGIGDSSPAYDSGIPNTAIIISITDDDGNKYEVGSKADLFDHITHCGKYSLEYNYKGTIETKDVILGTFVQKVVTGSPADHGNIVSNSMIYSITKINSDREQESEEVIIGPYSDVSNFLKDAEPGQNVLIKWRSYSNGVLGNEEASAITLGNNDGVAYLGVVMSTSGFGFTTPNEVVSVGIDPFYGRETIGEKMYGLLSFVGNAFSGYSPVPEYTHWWYDSNVLPNDVFWVIMSLLFWTFWLNIVLGITNALPAVPFDGGFLFMGGLSFILEKFGMKNDEQRELLVDRIGTAVTYVTLAMVIIIILVMVI